MSKPIALASDHAGFRLKEAIKEALDDADLPYKDFGTCNEESCDFPDFGSLAARAVSEGDSERGIIICGSAAGMTIVANKFAGVRAVACNDEWITRKSREHNDANVLALGGRVIDHEEAKKLVHIWLNTPFEGGRHARRVAKIAELERTPETTS